MPGWAIVTGGSQGIGYIAAKALAGAGYSLVLGARGRRRLEEAAQSLAGQYGVRVEPAPVDLTQRQSLEAFLDKALALSGGSVEAAVISYGNPACEPCTLEEATWNDLLQAARLYIASTHSIMKILADKSTSPTRVIVVSSFTVRTPHPPLAVADTIRAGLYPLVRLAARQWPGRIIPILLVMGSIHTPGAARTVSRIARLQGADPQEYWKTHVEALSPLGRTARLEELEALIKFLARAPEYMAGGIVEFHGASTTSW